MSRLNGMALAFGWILGYFILTFPIRMAMPHSLVYSLLHSILGLAIAIVLFWVWRKR